MNKRILGNALLLLTAFIWGTAFVAQRVGMEDIEPITFNAARMVLAAAMVGATALFMRRKAKERIAKKSAEYQKQYKRNTIIGGICCGSVLTVASILQQAGLVYTTAGKAGFITAMYILLVPMIAQVFLKQKNTLRVWIAVIMGVVGMYLLCITESFSLSYGDALVGLSALFFSLHILCCAYFVVRGNPISISAIQFMTCAIISAVFAVIIENPSVDKLISALVPIVYCGIVSGGIGYTLQLVAQRYTDPTIASLLMSMESVFAVLAGVIILHERMTVRELFGCIIMAAAIVMVQIPAKKERD